MCLINFSGNVNQIELSPFAHRVRSGPILSFARLEPVFQWAKGPPSKSGIT